jgi:hypothetical protein
MRRALAALAVLVLTLGLGGSTPAAAAPSPAAPALVAAPDPQDPAGVLAPPPVLPPTFVHIAGPHVTVAASPEDAPVARHLAAHAESALPRLARALGLPAGGPILLVLAPDAASFAALQPGAPPDWADGTAWPTRGLVFLHAPRARRGDATPLAQVLDHELVHIILGRAFAPRRVPTWLQEGLAQLYAAELGPDAAARISAARLGDSLLSLRSLTGAFPEDAGRARLAYAQSADFVAYVRAEHGEESLRALIGALAAGRPFEEAVGTATGQSVDALDRAWRARLDASPAWISAAANESLLFTVGAGALVLGALGARRRKRRTLARWEAEERVQEAWARALAEARVPRPAPAWPHPVPDEGA